MTITIRPRGLRQSEAEEFVGGRMVLDLMKDAGLIKPMVNRHRFTLWSAVKLEIAFDTVETQGFDWLEAAAAKAREESKV